MSQHKIISGAKLPPRHPGMVRTTPKNPLGVE